MSHADLENFLEVFWDKLLSREPAEIMSAWAMIDATEQEGVLAHLQRMLYEEGWQPEQRQSARAAWDVLSRKVDDLK